MNLQNGASRLKHHLGTSLGQGIILTLSSVLISILNFSYQIVLGKYFSLEDFSVVSLIGSLLTLATVPLSAYSRTLTHQIALVGDRSKINTIWNSWRQISWQIGVAVSLIWIGSMPFLRQAFQLDSILPILIISPIWLVSISAALDAGTLGGKHRFASLAAITWTNTIVLMTTTILSMIYNRPLGVYIALTASTLASFAIGRIAVHKSTKTLSSVPRKLTYTKWSWSFFHHSLLMKVATVGVVSLDVIMVKYFFSPEDAGKYAILTLVGKAIFYISLILGQFIIPVVSKDISVGVDPARKFKYIFSISSLLMLIMYLASVFLAPWGIQILFGPKGSQIIPYIPWYGLGMVGFGIANLAISYKQTLHQYKYSYINLISITCMIIGMSIFHDSIAQISLVMATVGIMSTMLVIGLEKFSKSKSSTSFLFPAQIGRFVFQSQINLETIKGNFYARYRDSSESAFLKAATKPYLIKYLDTEAKMLQILSRVTPASTSVVIPQCISYQVNRKHGWLLTSWIDGNMSTTPDAILKAEAYIHAVGSKIPPSTKEITSKPGWKFTLLAIYWMQKLIILYPSKVLTIIRLYAHFLKNAPALMFIKATHLAHRDMCHENILLLTNDTYALIDHSHLAFTTPAYDLIWSMSLYSDNPDHWLALSKRLKKIYPQLSQAYIAALGIYCLMIQACTDPKALDKASVWIDGSYQISSRQRLATI